MARGIYAMQGINPAAKQHCPHCGCDRIAHSRLRGMIERQVPAHVASGRVWLLRLREAILRPKWVVSITFLPGSVKSCAADAPVEQHDGGFREEGWPVVGLIIVLVHPVTAKGGKEQDRVENAGGVIKEIMGIPDDISQRRSCSRREICRGRTALVVVKDEPERHGLRSHDRARTAI